MWRAGSGWASGWTRSRRGSRERGAWGGAGPAQSLVRGVAPDRVGSGGGVGAELPQFPMGVVGPAARTCRAVYLAAVTGIARRTRAQRHALSELGESRHA